MELLKHETEVAVSRNEHGELHGYIREAAKTTCERYGGTTDLLIKLERIFDEKKMPMAATELRGFKGARKKEVRIDEVDVMAIDEMKKVCGTFVVRVQYRQNATWQGQVHWAEKNETKSFRSALELIKMMDEATEVGERALLE